MVPQPKPRRFPGFVRLVLTLLVLSLLPAASQAQTGPRILHQGLKCVLSGEHLILEALVEPTGGLTTVKAYFRADLYSQFYYIEMVRAANDVYQGVLPRPSPEISGLHYYLEAMDSSFNSVRTAEYTPEVVSSETSCRERNPTPAAYLDGTGAITVGSTGAGPALPPGFLPQGIAGTIPAIGRAASGGSGLLIGGVAAAAGAAIGVGVLVTSGNEPNTTTTSVPGGATTTGATTSVPGATTSAPPPGTAVMACFETSPNPPRIPIGGSIRFDASCTEPPREQIRTYVWNFNDGRGEREGRVVNRVYGQPGIYGTVLTVTTLSGEQDTFEMNVVVDENPGGGGGGGGAPGPPSTADIQLLTSGSLGAVVTHTFTIRNNGPLDANGVTFSTTISGAYTGYSGSLTSGFSSCTFSDPSVNCTAATMAAGASFTVTVTVTPTSSPTTIISTATSGSASPPDTVSNNNATVTTLALRAPPGSPGRIITRLTSLLELPPADGSTQAQVIFNESRTAMTDNSGPSTHEVPGRNGENTVEALLTSNPRAEGVWRFDFRGAPGFVAGSFVTDEGQVVSRQSHEITFRVAPGIRRVRFRYRME